MNYAETIAQHGGSSALARKLGIRPNSVSNWKARGIPKPWAAVIRGLEPSAPVTPSGPTSVTVQVGGLEVTITVRQL